MALDVHLPLRATRRQHFKVKQGRTQQHLRQQVGVAALGHDAAVVDQAEAFACSLVIPLHFDCISIERAPTVAAQSQPSAAYAMHGIVIQLHPHDRMTA